MSANKERNLFVYRSGDDISKPPFFEIGDLFHLKNKSKIKDKKQHSYAGTNFTEVNNKAILVFEAEIKSKSTLAKILTFAKRPHQSSLLKIPTGEWSYFLIKNNCFSSEYNFEEELQFLRLSLIHISEPTRPY